MVLRIIAFSCLVVPAIAAPPCVQFDVASSVAALDVTSPDYEETSPDEKLVRIQMPISSLVRLGREESLLQYLYVISGSSQAFQIVDYAPKTMLVSDVAGNLDIQSSEGKSANIGIKAFTPPEAPVKGDANASLGSTSSDSVRFEKLPPRQLIAASGTMHRGHSAYFKLKPSSQTTLEGDKTFEIVARVPQDWRGGLMHVSCAAFGKPRGLTTALDESDLVCGSRGFVVGVHMHGDLEARDRVGTLLRTTARLKQLAQVHTAEIAQNRYPTLGHKLGAVFSVVKPRIPDHWLDELLASGELTGFQRHLPESVRVAAQQYTQARQEVAGLGVSGRG